MTIPRQYQIDSLNDRYGLKVASLLSDAADELSPDITERLRFARSQALSRRKLRKVEAAKASFASGSSIVLGSGEEGLTWWNRIGATVPLLALVLGLVAIQMTADDRTAHEFARLDAELLTDDLPPAAYVDPGFYQFLKTRGTGDQ
jgi:hypothetical protein